MSKARDWIGRILEHRTLIHVLYWSSILILYPFYAMFFGADYFDSFVIKLLYLPTQIAATYLLAYFLIPKLAYRRRYLLFVVSVLIGVYLFSTLSHLTDDFGLAVILWESHPPHTFLEVLSDFYAPYYVVTAMGIPVFTTGIKLTKQQYEEKRQVARLQQEKSRVELRMLKARIHPRFLFNTLEHLHTLTLRASDEAPEVVVKLSDMLDYMLYEANADRTPAGREVELIQRYLELEKLRYGERLTTGFRRTIADPGVPVAPLLLLSMVEQAFRYGVAEAPASPYIQIDLEVQTEQLRLTVLTNQPWIDGPPAKNDRSYPSPEDVRRQLSLAYPGAHQLEQTAKGERWETKLVIQL